VVGLEESVQGAAAVQRFVDPPGTAELLSLIALPLICVPSSLLVRGVDMRVATAQDLLLVTQPTKPVSVSLAPAASVPNAAVGMFCTHVPALPHEIVGATAAETPCACVAVSA
jgi:hypothetical protein